jgi:hypothetical protein
MKTCSRCKKTKAASEFQLRREAGQIYVRGWCTACLRKYRQKYRSQHEDSTRAAARKWHQKNAAYCAKATAKWRKANPDKYKAQRDRWRVKNADKLLEQRLQREFGITIQQFRALEASQESKCAICFNAVKLHVDHDHSSKAVRGLLCGPCNRGIGLLKDDVQTLLRAAHYLRRAHANASNFFDTKPLQPGVVARSEAH